MTDDRLVRRLGTGDAVVLGLGSMIGAGVFAAFGPAARAAGAGLLAGLVLAAVIGYCNAMASARSTLRRSRRSRTRNTATCARGTAMRVWACSPATSSRIPRRRSSS